MLGLKRLSAMGDSVIVMCCQVTMKIIRVTVVWKGYEIVEK